MKIIYSYNKSGDEAEFWGREIAAASSDAYTFIPFNHGAFMSPRKYVRAQLLDNHYYEQDAELHNMYKSLLELIEEHKPEVLLVDNRHPYHPEFLMQLKLHKVIRTSDGPITAYDRDFAYLHAYDQVLYHTPGYSRDLDFESKLHYCGARNVDFWPLGLFDRMYDQTKNEHTIMEHERDIDIVFVGATHLNKMPLITKVKKAFGKRCIIHGLSSWKRNLYFAWKYRYPYWTRPVAIDDYVKLYQRAKIGFNVHNRGKYTLGGYRFFELPGNGVMQISDGSEYLSRFFDEGNEIAGYSDSDDLIEKIKYYLENDAERERVAVNGYKRVMEDYQMKHLMIVLGDLLREGIARKTNLI